MIYAFEQRELGCKLHAIIVNLCFDLCILHVYISLHRMCSELDISHVYLSENGQYRPTNLSKQCRYQHNHSRGNFVHTLPLADYLLMSDTSPFRINIAVKSCESVLNRCT